MKTKVIDSNRIVLCIALVLVSLQKSSTMINLNSEAILTTGELVTSAGYPMEEHPMKTSDGYILTHYRIPGGKNGEGIDASLPPVVLVHGMLTSSRDYVVMGPTKSLGFLLADIGYDVWMINMRFTRESRHAYKTKQDPTYWDFSFDEHGLIDVPESMDYVLKETKAAKVHYIGYSMGCTVYIVMCHERPDLAKRMASFVGLAPAVYMTNMRPIARTLEKFGLLKMLMNRGLKVISFSLEMQMYLATNLCNARNRGEDFCLRLLYLFVGEDYDQIDWEKSALIFSRFQAATLKQFEHFLQLISTNRLAKFDYGRVENLLRYGSEKPPSYNMTSNVAPVILYYGENDRLTTYKDANKLANILKTKSNTLTLVRKANSKTFNHIDFIYARDVRKLINIDVIKQMARLASELKYENKTVEIRRVPWNKFNHMDFAIAKDIGKLLNMDVVKAIQKFDNRI